MNSNRSPLIGHNDYEIDDADIKARSPNPSPKPEIKTAAKATSVIRSMQGSRVCQYRAHGDNGYASKSLFVTVAAPAGPAAPNDGAKMKAETFGRIGEDSPRDDCFQRCRCSWVSPVAEIILD